MSIRLTPAPHHLPAAKPPSPQRPSGLKLAVRVDADGAPACFPAAPFGFPGLPAPQTVQVPPPNAAVVSLPTSPTNVAPPLFPTNVAPVEARLSS